MALPTSQAAPLNPSPKTRFQESADSVKKHRDLIDSKEFQRGCDFALLQYQAELSQRVVDGTNAAANYFRVLGAQEFIQTLRLLSETTPKITVVDRDNLKPLE